jgi:hypothetical protein
MVRESKLTQLQATLKAIGKQTLLYRAPDGSQVLQLLHGGRVLGLSGPSGDSNLYWTNPALESEESARQFYAGNDWHNSGGDRTWLAPEVDFFFPQFPNLDLSTYWQQRQLDPGNYKIVECDGSRRMVSQMVLTASRTKGEIELEIAKWVRPAPNPLRHEREWKNDTTLTYAGYAQHTALRILDGQSDMAVGLWNLVQMPHGGELYISTYERSDPKVYMGEVAAEDLAVSDRAVLYRMQAAGEHKIGLRAAGVTGRVGYQYSAGDHWVLIIRNFFVNPSGEYVDVPWREADNFGYAVQACNVNSRWGAFSELEYHVPAIGGATGLTSCEDVSQIWSFSGPLDRIRHAAEALLPKGS